MKSTPSAYKSFLLFSLLALLASCSPSEKAEEAKAQSANTQTNEDQSPEALMAADGWRKGTLHIEVNISQSGDSHETGTTSLDSKWTSDIKAVSEEKIMLAPDLRPFVSSDPLQLEDVTQYEPFRILDPDADTIKSSEANHTASWSLVSDEAKDTKQGTFEGKVSRVYLQSLHPSLFGPGYEAYLKINLTGKVKTKETLSAPGQAAVNNENEKDEDQEIAFFLYPVPNKEKLNDFNYLPAGMSEEMKQAVVSKNTETLAILNQTYADTLPVQGDIRAGMKSEATADKLTLSYEYKGNKEIGYAAMLGVTTGMPQNNHIDIKITLSVDK